MNTARFIVGVAGLYLFGFATGAVWTLAGLPEPPPVQPMNGYVIRRVEMKLVDTRANPDRSINPSWMVPNMRFTCLEDRP